MKKKTLKTDAEAERDERNYVEGSRMAWRHILSEALRRLDEEDDLTEKRVAHLVAAREDVRAALRGICEEYGDNDWEDDLNLADVIEKHLRPHLDAE